MASTKAQTCGGFKPRLATLDTKLGTRLQHGSSFNRTVEEIRHRAFISGFKVSSMQSVVEYGRGYHS
jgi:hypothetical protein